MLFLKSDGVVWFAPVYDFAPMKAAPEQVTRLFKWGRGAELAGDVNFTQVAQQLADYARLCKVSEKTLREVEKGNTEPRLSIIECLFGPAGLTLSARLQVNRLVPMAELVSRSPDNSR